MAIENWTKLSIFFFHFCLQNCKMLKIINFHFHFLNLEIKICWRRIFHFLNLFSQRKIQNYIKYDIFKFCLRIEKSKPVVCHYPWVRRVIRKCQFLSGKATCTSRRQKGAPKLNELGKFCDSYGNLSMAEKWSVLHPYESLIRELVEEKDFTRSEVGEYMYDNYSLERECSARNVREFCCSRNIHQFDSRRISQSEINDQINLLACGWSV